MDDGGQPRVRLEPGAGSFSQHVEDELRDVLAACPDLAFAYLMNAEIEGHGEAGPVLLAWVSAGAMGSLKGALNLISEGVARALPDGRFMDVVILNSAPELLADAQLVAEPFVVNDSPELERARAATTDMEDYQPLPPRRRFWWWPF